MDNLPTMLERRHPETGRALRLARESLFTLLVLALAISAGLDALINLLGTPPAGSWRWWAWLGLICLVLVALVLVALVRDDRRCGLAASEMTLHLPYMVTPKGRVTIGVRKSYPVTERARNAWQARYGDPGLRLQLRQASAEAGLEGKLGQLKTELAPSHFDLVRYLLTAELVGFGRDCESDAPRSQMQLGLPLGKVPWEALPQRVCDNPFWEKSGSARPGALVLPKGTTMTADMHGDCLVRLSWRRWQKVPFGPRGEVRVRWRGPLSYVSPADKPFELLTMNLKVPKGQVAVLTTRMVVEVDTRWNFVGCVGCFQDWGLNLTHRLVRRMDYLAWWEYLVQRTVLDLYWKIGRIEKDTEPSLAERLRRMDERLARLEAHLWPEEPVSGRGEGAWVSGQPADEVAPQSDDEDALQVPESA